ncbi:hypothetical protein U1289_11200 [Enterococcus cecorum]|uniref:hypothetical protein n=1 Tax=Enterococcus cecorum TaxID=44008 RepID=UPI002ACAE65D|nr:hypothetical protein [Enterococcus cecorum]MDZ5578681.1 hypothetical protein [Enterococcus cecorum]
MAKKTAKERLSLPLYDELRKLDQDVFVSTSAYEQPGYINQKIVLQSFLGPVFTL